MLNSPSSITGRARLTKAVKIFMRTIYKSVNIFYYKKIYKPITLFNNYNDFLQVN